MLKKFLWALLALSFLYAAKFVLFPSGPITTDGEFSIAFEILKLDADGARTSYVQGSRQYPATDIFKPFNPNLDRRELMLTPEFSIGGEVDHDGRLAGFGLWMSRHAPWYQPWSLPGFSWEWFDLETGTIYRKRQGGGKVRVTLSTEQDVPRIASVEFLSDITFRLESGWPLFERRTHEMIIKAGSVFSLGD